jgi:hypothetical protein
MANRPEDLQTQPGSGPAPADGGPGALAPDPVLLDPSEAEVEEWAARERQRREAWLSGPTQEERAAWARRERDRRLAESPAAQPEQSAAEPERRRQRYVREGQLAAEGALSLFLTWSRRGLDLLVQKGREWEDEAGQPGRRRRVPLDDEPS